MNPQLFRAMLLILAVRAIFISPALGSESGPSQRRADSVLKRIEAIRPYRLRFTKPFTPAAFQGRVDCLDGGDDDDRTVFEIDCSDPRFELISIVAVLSTRSTLTSTPCLFVRLRC